MKHAKVIYYTDELNDDFAGTNIRQIPIDSNYKYINKSLIWRFSAFVIYRIIVTPLLWLFTKLVYGYRIKNRRAVKKIKKSGFFLYGNHTHNILDAFTPPLVSFPRRAYTIANADAVSIKGIRKLVSMLGCLPLPSGQKTMRMFVSAINERYDGGDVIAIYPEAHIWPYFTGIRPFSSASFGYPVKLNAPCVAFVTTYKKRRLLSFLPPKICVTLSEPFYPDAGLSPREAKEKLRDQVHDFMVRTAADKENYARIEYRRLDKNGADTIIAKPGQAEHSIEADILPTAY